MGLAFAALTLASAPVAVAQDKDFVEIVESLQNRSEAARTELSELRKEIKGKKVPLTRELNELEDQLIEIRKEYDRVLRIRDGRSLDVSNLRAQIKSREDQNKYLTNLLDEYARNFETRLHIAETQHYGPRIRQHQNDGLNSNLSQAENFEARLDLVELSVSRLEDGLGGAVFNGTAADDSGVLHNGKFLILGPLAYFSTEDGSVEGLADARLNSNEPVVLSFPADVNSGVTEVIYGGEGILPIDPTLGDAIKVSETQQTLLDEWKKGGAVMYPLLGLAGISLLIGFFKWLRLSSIGLISDRHFERIMIHLEKGEQQEALALTKKVRGLESKMLAAGIEHYKDPRLMVEEILFERILQTKTKLNSMLPFISITAASAPLLGLLGTVTGMINTFKLITIFGTGDASTFSSGISEALITTKWGLIVAIPTLLLYGFLSRKAKSLVDHMEQVSINFLNRLPEEKKSVVPAPPSKPQSPDQFTPASGKTATIPLKPSSPAKGDDEPGHPPLPPEGAPA